jgi:hypothetical protein
VVNDGDIMANGVAFATGVNASANGRYRPILVLNNGDISANSTAGSARGISAYTYREYSPIYIGNSGTVTAKGGPHLTASMPTPSTDIAASPSSTMAAPSPPMAPAPMRFRH